MIQLDNVARKTPRDTGTGQHGRGNQCLEVIDMLPTVHRSATE